MNLKDLFPNLTEQNHNVTSPRTVDYNCVAWAAGDSNRWWQPGIYWPIPSTKDGCGIGELVLAFESLGYESCDDGSLESGFEKIALYAIGMMYTHVARQLANGSWTSKLGQLEDIQHDSPAVIEGSDYGEVLQFMKRALIT